MSKIKKALIVGGGIGGLSAGIALRKAGIEVEIAEISKEYNVYGVGIIQQANALRALDALGVADEAMRRGSPYGKLKLCTVNGMLIGETGTPPIGRFPSHNGISRKILHEVLHEAAIEHSVKFRMGLTIASIQNEENSINVEFTDGSTGTFDVLIGADGINSKVRKLVFGEYQPNYTGASVWRYAFKRPAELDTSYMFFGKNTKMGLVPMTAETMYMFLVSAEGDHNPIIPESELIPRLQAHLKEYSADLAKGLSEQITDPKGVIYRPLETLMLSLPWHKNRVIMIGDAAHATIPQLGSGAALAIEDAVVLGELINTDDSVETIFEKYIARRYERCKMVVDVSETIGKWEMMNWKGIELPEGANIAALMDKTLITLTENI